MEKKKRWHLYIEYYDTQKFIGYRTTRERMIFHLLHIIAYAFQPNNAFKKLTLWRDK